MFLLYTNLESGTGWMLQFISSSLSKFKVRVGFFPASSALTDSGFDLHPVSGYFYTTHCSALPVYPLSILLSEKDNAYMNILLQLLSYHSHFALSRSHHLIRSLLLKPPAAVSIKTVFYSTWGLLTDEGFEASSP